MRSSRTWQARKQQATFQRNTCPPDLKLRRHSFIKEPPCSAGARSRPLLSLGKHPPSGGARLGEKNPADRTSAPSVTPEDQTKHSKRRGEARSNQTFSDGRTDNSNPHGHFCRKLWRKERKGPRPAVPSAEATKASGAKESRKKQAAPPLKEPLIPSLNALPGSGSGLSSPSGEDTQGPSPVDYTLEIEVVFPLDMVLEMQKCAAQRARKTVIGRTLRGRASHKDLVDCFKLHLPAPFVTTSLLTRGYFEILFENEEGAKATRKLAAVEWSGWALSFSKYSENFRPNELGVEKLLTHSIKVQFPDLHAQFCSIQALTIMASSIGEVLDIESPDSYIKRPAGPMVTIEVRDISKLAGIIRIPSMFEGADAGETTAQKILYSGLSNQCRKCQRFGHLARACSQNKPPTQGGNTSVKTPPPKGSSKTASRKTSGAQRWRQTTANTVEGQPDLEMKESSELPTQPEDKAKHTHELLAEGRQRVERLPEFHTKFRIPGNG
ncbi:unnamed protein product [Sphagnum jensenii]|uniref:CCHC-type domain-containing protein n=1 Tax=Sphagnum jensenii TaxID=128206 RepID=A0ABP1AHH8_9BRYO